MEDVLAVYTRPHDPDCPLVCLDETSKQLIAQTRSPIPMKAGRPARCDYEYERNGTVNLFMLFAPLEGKRQFGAVLARHCGRMVAVWTWKQLLCLRLCAELAPTNSWK